MFSRTRFTASKRLTIKGALNKVAPSEPSLAVNFEVRRITAEETLALRLPILRAGLPRETAVFPGDENPTTCHFGAFVVGRLAGVASIYEARFAERPEITKAWQLRGMATLPEVRGRGSGRALLATCVEEARAHEGELLWCNARTPAVAFYARHGWRVIGAEFEIPTAGPHFRMWIALR